MNRSGNPREASSREAVDAGDGKRKKRWPRKITAVALILITLSGLLVLGGVIYAWRVRSAVSDIDICEAGFTSLPDGEYSGYYQEYHAKADVLVTVKNGRVAHIELVNDSKNRADIEKVLKEVVDRQCLDVDMVSGASGSQLSQKTALKAVEIALEGGGSP